MRWPSRVLACLLFLPAAPAGAAEYAWPVLGVIDGDTIRVQLEGLPPELAQLTVRLDGIDAPERGGRAKCAGERKRAEAATAFVVERLAAGKVTFEPIGWDKYGGRIIAVVRVNGMALAPAMIRAGLGRAYDGGKRSSWC